MSWNSLKEHMKNLITQEQINKSGIYKITNIINNKIYIGCSKNISSRYRSHICDLKQNKSSCRILQSAVIKYGIDNFTFEILEICDNYYEREIILLQELKPEYNIVIETTIRRKISQESRQLMSEKRKGIPSPFKGTLNPNYKRTKKYTVLYNNKKYNSVQELADYLTVSIQSIYQAFKNNTLIKGYNIQINKV
jgi:hypothetical protein